MMNKRTGEDKNEIELLFRKNFRQLCIVSMNYVHDKDSAEDVVQEFFIKYWEKSGYQPHPDNFTSYAKRAVINISIDYIRKGKVQSKRDFDLPNQTDAFDPQQDQDELDERHTRLERIFELIETLPPGQQAILKLHAIEKLTYAQIAERQGVSINTVRTQLTRAYASLRKSTAGLVILMMLKNL